jgi:hypothetical protein
MSIIQELEKLIDRTGSHTDRDLLLRVLEQLKKSRSSAHWGAYEERKIVRK